MKVLWVTNVAPAAASHLLENDGNPFGGWLDGSLMALGIVPDLEITVAFPHPKSGRIGSSQGITYMGFPPIGRRAAEGRGLLDAGTMLRGLEPDLVHIHGTEMPHSLSFSLSARELGIPAVISLQGLVSVIAEHYRASLPFGVFHAPGARPWVRSNRVSGQQRAFELQGRLEARSLQAVRHVIGRTSWDRACSSILNPTLRYHHCDETLRPAFYGATRDASRTQPMSVVVGQGHYPVKGLHHLIEALPHVVARQPRTTVKVAGHSPVSGNPTPFGRHLARLIRRHRLEDHIAFTGPLGEVDMLRLYETAAVVVCPSVIENSPNSVAEAMLLGLPVIAAHVGGVPDMITSGVDGMTYQGNAPYMLADALITLFGDEGLSERLGANARRRALTRHDPESNADRTLEIYKKIANEEGER